MGSDGSSLADPASNETPEQLQGNYAIYAIADQTLWQEAGNTDNGLNGFIRIAIAPQQDRNSVSWYVDSGLVYKGLIPGRDDDSAGVGIAFAKRSSGAANIVKAQKAFSGTSVPTPTSEVIIEATYQASLSQWFSIQPFFQYVIRPGGNVINPENGERVQNAAIFGLRAAATF